jgi:hypothetical protein
MPVPLSANGGGSVTHTASDVAMSRTAGYAIGSTGVKPTLSLVDAPPSGTTLRVAWGKIEYALAPAPCTENESEAGGDPALASLVTTKG